MNISLFDAQFDFDVLKDTLVSTNPDANGNYPTTPGFTVNDLTVSAIGCLIDNFHSSGKVPMLIMFVSIKLIIKKTIKDGII